MDSKKGAAANYQISYFQPESELIQDGNSDVLMLYLTGFRKDQLKAQLTGDSESRILKISGARQLEDNRWISFHKDFPLLQNCDTQKISARFEDGILFVTMPKLISPAEKEDSKLPPSETQKPQKPTEEPVDTPEKNREQPSQKTLASDDQDKQNGTENIPEKSDLKDETKSQEQASEKTLGNDDQKNQIDAKNVPDKSLEKEKTDSSNARGQEKDHETASGSDDPNKQNIAKHDLEKSLEKKETESSNADNKNVKEKSAVRKNDSIEDDQNANRCLSDKGKEFSSKGTSQNMNSWAKSSANASADPARGSAAMLKMARQKMKLVVSVLLAFLIALYVSNLIWYSKKAEN